jgi:ribosomal protein S6--L-glutamate ligase
MPVNKQYVALGSRLAKLPEVQTLGVKPNFYDYAFTERELILNSNIILYPTLNYAQFLTTIGKKIFPSLETYLYADEKIKQTTLFNMLKIPHPRTKIYYHLHHKDITKDFSFPFIAKIPRRSARGRGVFKINNHQELEGYLKLTNIAYVQEYLPHEKDLRVILINYEPILSYWRRRKRGDFRTNISQGGSIDFDGISDDGIQLAIYCATKCKFDDVGLDLIFSNGKWHIIEANMKYGRKALRIKGIDPNVIVREKLLRGEIPYNP